MPELPEVETIRRQLEREISGATIAQLSARLPRIARPAKKLLEQEMRHVRIESIERRAKLLIFRLASYKSLIVHLKLTGRLLLQSRPQEPGPYTRAVFSFADGRTIFFDDVRQFGYLLYLAPGSFEDFFLKQKLGPEPLEPTFTFHAFNQLLKKRPGAKIKPLLMDQTWIAGIGNVYSQEICFFTKVRPMRIVRTLKEEERRRLYDGMKKILLAATAKLGSSVDTYVDLYGRAGKYVPFLKVYGRAGNPCKRCAGVIRQVVMSGRGTAYCPSCQR